MSAVFGEIQSFDQKHGPPVDLAVFGDELYARYETPDGGYPVVYDEAQGQYTYALVQDGRYVSSGVPVSQDAPAGAVPHAREADAVRQDKAAARQRSLAPPRLDAGDGPSAR